MTTWPQATVPTFAAGYAPQQADFTTWVRNNLAFQASKVMFRAQQQVPGGQSLSNSTFSLLNFGATAGDILEDPYGGWSTTATVNQPAYSWLAPYTGLYEVTLTVVTLSAAAWLGAAVELTGGAAQSVSNDSVPSGNSGGCSGSLLVAMTGGYDYLQLGAAVSTTLTTDTTSAGRYPSAEIAYVSAG